MQSWVCPYKNKDRSEVIDIERERDKQTGISLTKRKKHRQKKKFAI